MAKRTRSPRKTTAKSTKSAGPRAAKSARSAKSATNKTKRPAKKTTARSTKSRASKPTRTKVATARKAASKASPKRTTRKRTAKTADSYIATLDGWCKECTTKLGKLVRQHAKASGKASKSSKSSRRRHNKKQQHGTAEWLAAGARQLGLGLRRGAELADLRKLLNGKGKKVRHIKFNRVTDFCKKEWKELAALAGRLNELASSPPPRERRKRK